VKTFFHRLREVAVQAAGSFAGSLDQVTSPSGLQAHLAYCSISRLTRITHALQPSKSSSSPVGLFSVVAVALPQDPSHVPTITTKSNLTSTLRGEDYDPAARDLSLSENDHRLFFFFTRSRASRLLYPLWTAEYM